MKHVLIALSGSVLGWTYIFLRAMTDRPISDGEHLLTIVVVFSLLICSVYLYFVPSIIARERGHRNARAIFWLNLLFGWTLLGWAGAMIWAVINSSPREEARSTDYCECGVPVTACLLRGLQGHQRFYSASAARRGAWANV